MHGMLARGSGEHARLPRAGLPSGGRQARTHPGHPLPGVSAHRRSEVEDPTSAPSLAPGAAGLMLVRGPNVMQGYLGNPAKTAAVLRDGWYVTGDIARASTTKASSRSPIACRRFSQDRRRDGAAHQGGGRAA